MGLHYALGGEKDHEEIEEGPEISTVEEKTEKAPTKKVEKKTRTFSTTKDPGWQFLRDGVENWSDDALGQFLGDRLEPRSKMEICCELVMVTLIRTSLKKGVDLDLDETKVRLSSKVVNGSLESRVNFFFAATKRI